MVASYNCNVTGTSFAIIVIGFILHYPICIIVILLCSPPPGPDSILIQAYNVSVVANDITHGRHVLGLIHVGLADPQDPLLAYIVEFLKICKLIWSTVPAPPAFP